MEHADALPSGSPSMPRDPRSGRHSVFRLTPTEPTVRLITQLLFAVLVGDLPALESQFSVTGEVGDQEWSIELTPKVEALRKALISIQLKGDRAVRWVQLREPTGDTTSISLSPEAIRKSPPP